MRAATLLGMGADALRYRVSGRRSPTNVMIAVTNHCDGHCRYCAIPERHQQELSTRELLDLLDHLARRGTRRVAFWGGEPLCRPDIGLLVERAVRNGLWTSIDTNGHLFPQRFTEISATSHVLFSLDGQREGHEANRGEGTYDKVIEAIQLARAERFSFGTITVLTRHTVGDIDHILELAERYHFRAAFQVIHHTSGLDGDRGESFLPEDAAYRDALRRLRAARAAGRPVANSDAGLEHLLRWPDYRVPTRPSLDGALPCVAGDLFCNVDADGTVYPCSLLVEQVPALNLREVGFDAAFEATRSHPCHVCTATAFTEYSHLFRLSPRTAVHWVRNLGVELLGG